MSMIQLKNLRDELTGLVESRFGSLQDLIGNLPDSSGNTGTGDAVTVTGNQDIFGIKTFHERGGFISGLDVKHTMMPEAVSCD